jgi:PLP dependent protein
MDIKERLDAVRADIGKAMKDAGREPGSVVLMAVSKMHGYDEIMQAYEHGQLLFGENRVQEVIGKFPLEHHGFSVHLIGHLQSNKVKKIIPYVDGIDSVDSLKLARIISDECLTLGRVLPILVEINTSGEASKFGFADEYSYLSFLDALESMPGIRMQGLMTIGPLTSDEIQVRKAFSQLRELREKSRNLHPEYAFDTLSMGMSQDYQWAIKEGSTLVRIGTAIFGNRDY